MAYRLKSLSSSGGFLKNAPIHFEAGLNTIIGARGTCKSTCVETIRFVFDCDAAKVQALCKTDQADSGDVGGSHAGMLGATLGSGIACCRLTKVDHSDGDEITIEREVGGPSSIYRNGIEELADRDILHMVEIYSQGDLQRIARDPPLRLNLIDRPNQAEIAGLKERRGDVAQQLTTVGRSIRDLNRSIESRQADIRGLGTLRRQLQELQAQRPELSEELEAERSEVGRRNVILDSAKRGASSATETIRRLREATATPIDFAELANEFVANDSVNNQRLAEGFAAMARICADVAKSMEHVDVDILHSAVVHLEAEFDERNKRYYELRREQEEVSDSLKREDGLRKQIAHLERLEHEFQALLVEKDAKLEERSKLRTKLQNITEQIHRLRQVEVERINQLHSEVVTLTLDLGVRSSQYAEEVERLLAGSGIRKQDEVASEVAALFRPCDLIDIVENADAERVAATLERDLRQMTRFVSHLLDSDSLYELEAILFEDSLEITLYDHGTPKSISELSNGQMATALLPLILRPAPYPLIFDQPEDDLDNSFVYRTLVQQIQRLKLERQLVFVTHNANIPVLGEADNVIVMAMETPTAAAPPKTGTVDESKESILSLLEGGSEAFRLRHQRYRELIGD